ncbi:MAG: hypothetical protein IJ680_09730 [Paludibacteraceae bacterium]|nr:hypothetical protein [Paludibacteraceae bacterium]
MPYSPHQSPSCRFRLVKAGLGAVGLLARLLPCCGALLLLMCLQGCGEPVYEMPDLRSQNNGVFEQYSVNNQTRQTLTLHFDHVVGRFVPGTYTLRLDTLLELQPQESARLFDDNVVGVDHDLELRPAMFKHYWWFLGRQTTLSIGSEHIITWRDTLRAETLMPLAGYDFYNRNSWTTDTLSVRSDSIAPGVQIMHTFIISQHHLDSLRTLR